MAAPLALAIPIGGVVALLAWALGEGKAEASTLEPKERKLTREEWEADKQEWIKRGDMCKPGYRVMWDDYDGSRAHFICVKLPTVDKVVTTQAAPGEVPQTVVVPTAPVPGPATIPAPAPTHAAPVTVSTPAGRKVYVPKDEVLNPYKDELLYPYPVYEKPAVVKIVEKKEAAKVKEEKKKSVSLAEWQKDMKKKQKDNNCGPGMAPRFDPFNGTWAEYHCEKQETVAEILKSKEEPKSQVKVSTSSVKEVLRKDEVLNPYPSINVKKVEYAPFEPEAAPFVEEALKSKDYLRIRDAADSISSQWPRAAAFLSQQSMKYDKPLPTGQYGPENFLKEKIAKEKIAKENAKEKIAKEKIVKEKPSEVVAILKSKEEVSKSQWEKDKKTKAVNCKSGYQANFAPYSGTWAEYNCVPSDKLKQQIAVLSAEGIESDVAEQVAVFLYNQPSPSQARSFAEKYKNKGGAYRIINQYASTTEGAAKGFAKTAPPQPKPEPSKDVFILDADEAKKLGKFVNETNDFGQLKSASDTFRNAGYTKEAKAVDEKMSRLLATKDKEKPAKIETRPAKTTTGEIKSLPVVQTIDEKRADENKKIADKKAAEAKKTDKQKAEEAKKQKEASAKQAEIDKAKQATEEIKKELAKPIEQQIFPELDEEKPGERVAKDGKKKVKVSGEIDEGADNSMSSPYSAGPVSVSSPIDGISDGEWIAFVRAMKTGKPSHITPSYALGMFGFGARRLEDYGLMTNARQVPYHGNTVWAGDWVEPMSLANFLTDAGLQYRLFEEDMLNKAQYVEESGAIGIDIDGVPASMSGLLAVAFKTTEPSFHAWLNASQEDRMRFPATMELFERANGIF